MINAFCFFSSEKRFVGFPECSKTLNLGAYAYLRSLHVDLSSSTVQESSHLFDDDDVIDVSVNNTLLQLRGSLWRFPTSYHAGEKPKHQDSVENGCSLSHVTALPNSRKVGFRRSTHHRNVAFAANSTGLPRSVTRAVGTDEAQNIFAINSEKGFSRTKLTHDHHQQLPSTDYATAQATTQKTPNLNQKSAPKPPLIRQSQSRRVLRAPQPRRDPVAG